MLTALLLSLAIGPLWQAPPDGATVTGAPLPPAATETDRRGPLTFYWYA